MDAESVAKSISLLLTSIGQTFADLYTTNPFISMQLDDFAEFIVTIGDVAEKGQLDKAADGISKIADAVNKIEIDKAVAFGDLFNSTSALSSNRGAYRALAKAVSTLTGYGISLWMNEDLRYKIQSNSDQGTSETEQGKIVDQNKDLDLQMQNRSNNISN